MSQQAMGGRYPLEAKAIGVLQNGKQKINILSILWSDHNDIMIYRRFEDFKKIDRELRRKFPLESGLFRKSENMIPKLRDVPLFRKNRNTSRFIERLRLLEYYSQELLKTDSKIAQCAAVIVFFAPTNSDLNPSFPENSVVIMPSEVREQRKREQPRPLPKPPASEPIVSQMYTCIEDYEAKDTKNRPFRVRRNEHLGVLIKENSGWWLVENEEKRVAWFPAPYLRALDVNEESDCGSDSEEGNRYYTTMAYAAMSPDEVSIAKGVLVEVIEKSNNGWWLIRYNGKSGFLPAMYLKPYRNCHQLQIMKNQGTLSSTSNLFKASSTLDLSGPRGAWKSEEEPRVPTAQVFERKPLDRKRSRSISGFPSHKQYGFQPTPPEIKPREVTQSPGIQWTLKPKLKITKVLTKPSPTSEVVVTTQNLPTQHPTRKSVGDVPDMNERNASSSKPPTVHHISQPDPGAPQIPKRPKQHEILSKCTTVTKKALKRKEAIGVSA